MNTQKTQVKLHRLQISYYLLWFVCFIAVLFSGCSNETRVQPNVILIQFDDLGYNDLGIHGNNVIKTPNIDDFARKSAQFTQFYVNPVCAPTRAALLTGRHYLRTGVSHVHGGRDFVSLDETTIAQPFKNAGYRTGMWGKWHSGHTDGYFPWDRGFDEAYMAQLYKHENSQGSLNGEMVEHRKWAEEVIVDYAIDFAVKNPDTPFFAYLSFLTCHRPLVAPENIVSKYIEMDVPEELATLYAMIEHADSALGEFFHFLEEKKLMDNSLVMIMSDNGPDYDAFRDQSIRDLRKVNHLRGYKGDIWENGVISPLFIRWGEKIKSGKINYLSDITDILPTLIELCNIEMPEGHLPLDGKSFEHVLLNENANSENDKTIVNYAHRSWPPANKHQVYLEDQYRPLSDEEISSLQLENQVISYRDGNYKLLINPNNPVDSVSNFLFNIVTDPQEEVNLYLKEPEVAQNLHQQLENWWKELILEKNAFGSPVFLIGGDKESIIPVKAPSQRSKEVRSNYKYGFFTDEDQQAGYDIKVLKEGNYTAQLRYDIPTNVSAEIQISVGNQTEAFLIPQPGSASKQFQLAGDENKLWLKINDLNNLGKNEQLAIESIILKRVND